MPGRDGTGPVGYGPRSGWGGGFCANNAIPRRMEGMVNSGCFGRTRGFRRMYHLTGIPGWERYAVGNPGMTGADGTVSEETMLSQQKTMLENHLRQINERLTQLHGNPTESGRESQ